MSTDQEIASVPESTIPNRVSFFGPPPLVEGEDPRAYDELLLRVFGVVNPSDLFEEIWTRDILDYSWQVLQLRRWKASLLTTKMKVVLVGLIMRPLNESLMKENEYELILFGRESAEELVEEWAKRNPSAIKHVDELLAGIGVTMGSVQAQALALAIGVVGQIDHLAMSAEVRRNAVWREINRHRDRKSFARALRNEIGDIEDAEVKCIEPKNAAIEATSDSNAA